MGCSMQDGLELREHHHLDVVVGGYDLLEEGNDLGRRKALLTSSLKKHVFYN